MAVSRGLKTGSILNHLVDCVAAELPLDTDRLGLTDSIKDSVLKAIRSVNSGQSAILQKI